jgi:uncharacterized membrane protein YhaH (DUF805 family)
MVDGVGADGLRCVKVTATTTMLRHHAAAGSADTCNMNQPTLTDAPWPEERMPPLRMFLDPRGRIGRRDFWLYGVAAMAGLTLLLQALLGIAGMDEDLREPIVNLLLLWPVLAVSIKRWHDRDKSGWWVLIVLVPVIGWLWALVVNGFLRGTPGPNRFGADPLTAED